MDIKFHKFDPAVDASASLVTITVPYKENQTVLETIQFAHEVTPIAFDYSCRGRACGRCAVMLDGTPVLACVTAISDGPHTIEPLVGHPVIRDLVVDKSMAHADLSRRYLRVRGSRLTTEDINTWDMSTDSNTQIIDMEWCTRCTVCTAACPARQANPAAYVGPAAMLAIAYRYYDPYDDGNRVAEAVQAGLWNCIMCGKCDEVCPQKEIKRVTSIWKELRAAATAAGYPDPKA